MAHSLKLSSKTERESHRFISDLADVFIGKRLELQAINSPILDYKRFFSPVKLDHVLHNLKKEKANCKMLSDAWTAAKKSYKRNANLPEFRLNGLPAEYHIALITYVVDKPQFYEKFNKLTRELKTEDDVENFPYLNYCWLLATALMSCKGSLAKGGPNEQLISRGDRVYRGVAGRVKVSPLEFVCFRQFLSTSRNKDMALKFAGDTGTLFIIEQFIIPDIPVYPALLAGISDYANAICLDHIPSLIGLNEEQECLIWPFEIFEITRVEPCGPNGIQYVYLRGEEICMDMEKLGLDYDGYSIT